MSKLAVFAFPFALAVLICQYLLPVRLFLLAGAVCVFSGLILYALLPRKARGRAALALFGLALGFVWCRGFDALAVAPARALDGAEVTTEATVVDFPEARDNGATVEVRIDAAGGALARAYVYDGSEAGLRPGDRVRLTALFSMSDRVKGERVTTFTSRGCFLFARSASIEEVLESPGVGVTNFHRYLARAIREKIRETFPLGAGSFMLALLTGDRAELNADEAAVMAMERAGVMHVVAISGMHVSILAGFLLTVLGKRRWAVAAAVPVMALFAAVSGFSASVLRAVVMQTMVLTAPLILREADSLTSLAAALLVLLLVNPYCAGGVGMQLSFAATLGIILFTPRMNEFLTSKAPKGKGLWAGIVRYAAGTVSTTYGALLLTAPISAVYFRSVSLVAPVSNLLILWAVSQAFVLGALAVGLAFLWLPLGRVAAFYPAVLVRVILFIVKVLSRPFMAAVELSGTVAVVWFALTYLGVLGFAVFRWRGRRAVYLASASACALCAILIGADIAASSEPGFVMTVLDVGQGQSIVITSGGYTAVIDCGSSSGEDAGEIAERYIRSLGRGRIDLLVLTHYHTDHVSGVTRLLTGLEVGTVAAPEAAEEDGELSGEIFDAARDAGCGIMYVTERLEAQLGDAVLTLVPPMGSETENERGLMAWVTAGDFDALITGDAPEYQERILVGKYAPPDVECLVVGHHGSAGSTGEALLDAVRPELAVVSVGADNPYGHPSEETVERLLERGIEVIRTDESGNIRIESGE